MSVAAGTAATAPGAVTPPMRAPGTKLRSFTCTAGPAQLQVTLACSAADVGWSALHFGIRMLATDACCLELDTVCTGRCQLHAVVM